MQSEHNPSPRADREDRDEAQRKAEVDKLAAKKVVGDLKWLMSDARGRRFMWRLLEQTHLFRTSFTGDRRVDFLEGERNIGIKIFSDVQEHCPEQYLAMTKEQRAP